MYEFIGWLRSRFDDVEIMPPRENTEQEKSDTRASVAQSSAWSGQ